MRNGLFSWLVGVAGLFGFGHSAAGTNVDYNRDIRPLLSLNCFACHGPDEEARKADLRLDIHEGALVERKGVPAITPGDRGKSELFVRISTDDPDDRMPPEDSGHELNQAEVEIIGKWID